MKNNLTGIKKNPTRIIAISRSIYGEGKGKPETKTSLSLFMGIFEQEASVFVEIGKGKQKLGKSKALIV